MMTSVIGAPSDRASPKLRTFPGFRGTVERSYSHGPDPHKTKSDPGGAEAATSYIPEPRTEGADSVHLLLKDGTRRSG